MHQVLEGSGKAIKIKKEKTQQKIPSFSVNPQCFNSRLIRIKQKIDELIAQSIPTKVHQINGMANEARTETSTQGRSSYQKSWGTNNGSSQKREMFPIEKIVGETKYKIGAIYNELNLLQNVAMKDENIVETNTFELRSFLKDLRNQNKRLIRLLPDLVLFEVEMQKKKHIDISEFFLEEQNINNHGVEMQSSQQLKMQSALRAIDKQFQAINSNKKNYTYRSEIMSQQQNHTCSCKRPSCQVM